MNRRLVTALVVCVSLATAVAVRVRGTSVHADSPPQAARPSFSRPSVSSRDAARTLPTPPSRIRWIAAGGGANPELNQISLAQDLALAREVLGPDGVLLFASGPGSLVQVRDAVPRGDPLMQRLGELFASRGGRDSHHEPAPVSPHGEATAEQLREWLHTALSSGSEPLLVYIAAHGEAGDSPGDNKVLLWAETELTVRDLVQLLDRTPSRRPVRFVMTACYSGGFAEMVFRQAQETMGPTDATRCGLFATTWDREASGCDPDPDRRMHEGYGLHFLHALQGRDRDGQTTPSIDLDGDGRIGLLEAHTYARIQARSIDVPTTTSERWLRSAAPAVGPSAPVSLPEEDAVIAAIAQRLGLSHQPERARDRLHTLETQRDRMLERLEALDNEMQDISRRVRSALLARWPVLDDPWHPDWSETMAHHRSEIEGFLNEYPYAQALSRVRELYQSLSEQLESVELEIAQLTRLVRAIETRTLAGRLRARGGRPWEIYQRLLACERSTP